MTRTGNCPGGASRATLHRAPIPRVLLLSFGALVRRVAGMVMGMVSTASRRPRLASSTGSTARHRASINFITRLLLWLGLAFQMPIIVYFIARVGLVTATTLRKQWRIAVVIVAVLSAVITPSIDPVTMLLTMAPLLALYILSIGLAVIGTRQYERAMELLDSQPAI